MYGSGNDMVEDGLKKKKRNETRSGGSTKNNRKERKCLKKKDISITNNDLIKIGNKYNLSIINLFPEESIPGFGIIPKDVTRAYLLYDVYISFKPEFHYTIYEAINLDGLQLTY